MVSHVEIVATILFAIAIIHTFSVPVFARLANRGGAHAGLWHMLSEVEAVFGIWACVLFGWMWLTGGIQEAVQYLDTRNFTEPAFVFVIMVVAASRPIIELVRGVVDGVARVLPVPTALARFFVVMTLVPLSGSLITEPAAMTLAALLLRDSYFSRPGQDGFKYLTVGVLFVNVSIGGVLTAYAAPPVLMVAQTFGWGTAFMATHFGWRAASAVVFNSLVLTLICRPFLLSGEIGQSRDESSPRAPCSPVVMGVHVLFLLAVVLASHHIHIFMGLLVLFIGYTQAYKSHQSPLLLREGLMVGFFLAGLVVLGGLQQWWLQDLLAKLSPVVLYFGATALTAITDNAALTYLGSLVDGTSELWRYMLVAGAVTGGGLTVIANAPNPAGFSILKGCFSDGTIAPLKLFLAAAVPTLVAVILFLLPNSFS
ncbi:MAG TPA: putative Na+/H+ antiporter [Castellaniella sp.]|uniref:putative Na+/H+ antiporter n=1 Tax=Castellaniella sp. TaxID=1955812 RepID=UPI002F20727C